MRYVMIAGLSLSAFGCDTVFGLDRDVVPVDARACAGLGHDEDLDGFPDDCDRCPWLADSIDADGDGDGVGDLCDPDPTRACERRDYFAGFDALPTGLVPFSGDWKIENDDLVQADASGNYAVAHFPGRSFSDVLVRAGVRVIDFSVTMLPGWVEIGSGLHFDGNDPDLGYGCRFFRDSTGPYALIANQMDGAYVAEIKYSGGTLTGPNELVLAFDNRPTGDLACTITGSDPLGAGSITTDMGGRSAGEVMMYAHEASAAFHWLEVLTHTCVP